MDEATRVEPDGMDEATLAEIEADFPQAVKDIGELLLEETCPRDGRSYTEWVEIASEVIGRHHADVDRAEAAEAALADLRAKVAAVESLIPLDGSVFAVTTDQLREAIGATAEDYVMIPAAALAAAPSGEPNNTEEGE